MSSKRERKEGFTLLNMMSSLLQFGLEMESAAHQRPNRHLFNNWYMSYADE